MLDADDSTTDRPEDRPESQVAGEPGTDPGSTPARTTAKKAAKKAAAKKTATKAAAKKTTARKTAKKTAEEPANTPGDVATIEPADTGDDTQAGAPMVLFQAPKKSASTRKRTAKATAASEPAAPTAAGDQGDQGDRGTDSADDTVDEPARKTAKKTTKKAAKKTSDEPVDAPAQPEDDDQASDQAGDQATDDDTGDGGPRRRRRRGGRRRRKASGEDADDAAEESNDKPGPSAKARPDEDDGDDDGEGGGSRRRRTRVRKPRNPEDEITSVSGSTRLEAKKQRRREGREAGRRRAPIVSEAEFLARRESVDRVMVIRQRGELTQIGVLEDKVLVEHYVARESQTSLIGNIYLGRVQNVLPSMEAAFVDIGKGRNAVLYAGEVNWSALGHKDGQPRKVESVLKAGQTILVQVTKDPVGHKGARLTGQISLPGRFLVYVPDGNTSGISRKLPDTERNRLKSLLKEIVPDTAGVIVRTAAEGASEDELTRDVERLTARWSDIEKKVEAGKGPELLYGEPDLTLKVVRDLFTEDFSKLVIQGDDAWDLVDGYVSHVAPDLRERLERFAPDGDKDVFAAYRVDEQIAKGLDRKVWLPSGGSLVIDRTEAMTVVDVNTGKFTGSGGNLEETVTKNNLEAAEEVVRQLRLRDIGGIIVVDFIDMVLESNRDLVLRRLVECLGRDRTRHQVAEVTSLGLVQMTRKRIGTGLLEAFGEECEHCKGRGVIVHEQPTEPGSARGNGADESRGRRGRGGRGRKAAADLPPEPVKPSPMALAGTKPHPEKVDAAPAEPQAAEPERVEESAAPADAPEVAPTEAEPTADDASQPVAPVVVTSTRRRRAARPAGPPAGATTAAEVQDPESETPDAQADASTPAAGDDDREAAVVEPDAGEQVAEDDADHGPAVAHVPVKKRGSRKR